MRRALTVAAVLLASSTLSSECARADPTPPPVDPGAATTFPELAFDGEARAITFPQASIDGSFTEDGTVITLRADVFFAYNKANLNAKAAVALDRAKARLTDLKATRVRVAGFTDSKGTAAYNRGLSKRRAVAVRDALASRLSGVTFQVKAYGESRPVATNKTGKGRALNRRVVITVLG